MPTSRAAARLAVVALLAALLVGGPASSRADAAPAPVEAAVGGVRSVAAGHHHSCALLEARQVRCWGDNEAGQLGNGQGGNAFSTAQVTRNASGTAPLRNVVQLTLGYYHTCALLTIGQVRCWGSNYSGQLGNGSNDGSYLPVVVRNPAGTGPLQGVRAISAEARGTCALLTSTQVRCWGDDGFGQLGDGPASQVTSTLPVAVQNPAGTGRLTGVVALDGGLERHCVVLANGQVRCWGRGASGVLGNGTADTASRPVVVRNVGGTGPLTGVVQMRLGGHHGCARLRNGQARCWGNDDYGQLGDGSAGGDHLLPVVVRTAGGAPLTGVRSIGGGETATCARKAGDRVQCWGSDQFGQLGDGTIAQPDSRPQPRLVRNGAGTQPLRNITALALGSNHGCARRTDGRVVCWGDGTSGKLGNGGEDPSALPVVVRT